MVFPESVFVNLVIALVLGAVGAVAIHWIVAWLSKLKLSYSERLSVDSLERMESVLRHVRKSASEKDRILLHSELMTYVMHCKSEPVAMYYIEIVGDLLHDESPELIDKSYQVIDERIKLGALKPTASRSSGRQHETQAA